MKYRSVPILKFIMLIYAIIGKTALVFSSETPFAYNPGAFCEQGAEKLMAPLVEANKEHFENIENIRDKIEKLKKKNALLCEVKAMRDNYEKSILELSKSPAPKTIPLDPLKSTIRNGLLMSAVSSLLKKDQLTSDVPLTMSTFCLGNEDLKICEKESGTTKFKQNLEPFLLAFKKSFLNATAGTSVEKDQTKLKAEIESIISAIPKVLDPEIILSLFDKKAPELSKILSQELPRQKVIDCLSNNKNSDYACMGILKNPKEKEALGKAITIESSTIQESLSKEFSPLFNEMKKRQMSEIEIAFNFSDDSTDPKERFKKLAQSVLEKAPDLGRRMRPSEINPKTKAPLFTEDGLFFYKPPKLEGTVDEEREKRELEAVEKANLQSKEFHKDCDFKKAEFNSANDEESAIAKCRVHLDQLKIGFELRESEFGKKLAALDEEMNRLLTNDNFVQTEKLKKYLAEKYICECSSKTGTLTKSTDNVELNITTCNQKNYKQSITVTRLDNLTKNLSAILKVNFKDDINTDLKQCESALRASNLEQYNKNCQGENAKKYKDLCSMLDTQAKKSRAKADEDKLWAKRYEENWVDFDNGKPKFTPKKTTGRLIAEGVLPVAVPKLIPMFFTQFANRQSTQFLMNRPSFKNNSYTTTPFSIKTHGCTTMLLLELHLS